MNLSQTFCGTLIMSGTPSESQKILTKRNPNRAVYCSPQTAMNAKIICKPTLNLIKAITDEDLVNAAISMILREQSICKNEVFRVKSVINGTDIDSINGMYNEIAKRPISKNWHRVKLHTYKKESKKGNIIVLESEIDGKKMSSKSTLEMIEQIDNGTYEPFNKDNEPIVVFQVNMISEGINVNSFNSGLITKHGVVIQIQQIGRELRDYELNINLKAKIKGDKSFVPYYSKIEDGHANIYCIYNNKSELERVFDNLAAGNFTCFDWGDHIDVNSGSNVPTDPNAVAEYNEKAWSKITDVYPDIEEIRSCRTARKSGELDKHLNVLYNILLKYESQINKALNTGISKKSGNGGKEGHKGKPKNKTNKTVDTEKKNEDKVSTMIRKLWRIMRDKVTEGDGRTIVRPYFDSDVEYYKSVMKCIGLPDKAIEALNDYFIDSNSYMSL